MWNVVSHQNTFQYHQGKSKRKFALQMTSFAFIFNYICNLNCWIKSECNTKWKANNKTTHTKITIKKKAILQTSMRKVKVNHPLCMFLIFRNNILFWTNEFLHKTQCEYQTKNKMKSKNAKIKRKQTNLCIESHN